VFWNLGKSSITIPAELHEKLARTSQPIEELDSEVICVRSVPLDDSDDLDAAEASHERAHVHDNTDNTNLADAIGYEAHWQWYR